MEKKTLKALKKSIAKWERNAEADTPTKLGHVRTGAKACPLCSVYWESRCLDCPVKLHTGTPGCRDTPYVDCIRARNELDVPKFRKAAQREVEFLQSLLPPSDPTS